MRSTPGCISPHTPAFYKRHTIEHTPCVTTELKPISHSSGLYGIAGASLVGCDAPTLMTALGSSAAGPAVKLCVSFPLVYHYLGAVRHTVSAVGNGYYRYECRAYCRAFPGKNERKNSHVISYEYLTTYTGVCLARRQAGPVTHECVLHSFLAYTLRGDSAFVER